jgi:hypothetical protein
MIALDFFRISNSSINHHHSRQTRSSGALPRYASAPFSNDQSCEKRIDEIKA